MREGQIGRSHLGKHLFGRNAAIHDPDAVGLAVLGSILRSIPRSVVLSEVFSASTWWPSGKRIGRHDQRNRHLHTVAALLRL